MKRSVINKIYLEAKTCFDKYNWAIGPKPRWDITDFGLNNFENYGLVLVNLAEESEYCEKLMYARENQRTPAHSHAKKKEDIICRNGLLILQLWPRHPYKCEPGEPFKIQVNGKIQTHKSGKLLELPAGHRITLMPGIYHEFWAGSNDCIIGEVSTANDDANDNFFLDENIGRFPGIEEDEPKLITLISENS